MDERISPLAAMVVPQTRQTELVPDQLLVKTKHSRVPQRKASDPFSVAARPRSSVTILA